MIIKADQKAGRLPVTAVDEGGRNVDLLNDDSDPLEVVAAPVQLNVSELTIAQERFGWSIAFTVDNPGAKASKQLPIGVGLPPGFTAILVVQDQGDNRTIGFCSKNVCPLGSIGPDESAAITVYFAAVSDSTSGTAKVTIDGVTQEKDFGGGLTVDLLGKQAAPSQATAQGAEPAFGADLDGVFGIAPVTTVPAPAPTSEPSTPTQPAGTDPAQTRPTETEPPQPPPAQTQPTVTQDADAPAAPTAPSTMPEPAAPEGTSPTTDDGSVPTAEPGQPGGSGAASTDPAPAVIPASPTNTAASPSPSDADGAQPAGEPEHAPEPPRMALTAPTGEASLTVGGTGSLRFIATNSGGQRSAPTAFEIGLPSGVGVLSVSVAGSTICDSQSCRLPGIDPGESISVVVTIAATPGAEPGGATATTDDGGVGWMLNVEPAPRPAPSVIPDAAIPDAVIPDAVIPDAVIPDAVIPDAVIPGR